MKRRPTLSTWGIARHPARAGAQLAAASLYNPIELRIAWPVEARAVVRPLSHRQSIDPIAYTYSIEPIRKVDLLGKIFPNRGSAIATAWDAPYNRPDLVTATGPRVGSGVTERKPAD
jgi:hypothetical protein